MTDTPENDNHMDWNDILEKRVVLVDPSNPVVGTCSKCGITLYRMMHYSCSRDKCPVFQQVKL